MLDLETKSLAELEKLGLTLFMSLLGLALVTVILGVFALGRLRAEAQDEGTGLSSAMAGGVLLAVAFLSAVFVPYLALVPAVFYLFRGAGALRYGGASRDGGIVLLLVGLIWIGYGASEAVTQAWSRLIAGAPIRVDILVTVPAMAVIGGLGWSVHRLLSAGSGEGFS